MPTNISPWSPTAERAVIGGAIISPSLLSDLTHMVIASDFRSPSHQAIWAAIEVRHRAGDPIDGNVIARDAIQGLVTDAPKVIADCIAAHGSSESTLTHARTVGDLAATRRIESIANTTLSLIHDEGLQDPAVLLDGLEADLSTVDLPNDPRPIKDMWTAADLLGADFPEPPWVIPGLLREGWRLLFVGMEGGGKSTMLRQIVAAAGAGRHPFTGSEIEPVPTMIVDVENPPSVIRDGLKRMERVTLESDCVVLSRPGGIDIRQRRDRDLLHRAFAQVGPKVCAIGPLYKLYRQAKGEPDELAAIHAQQVLDELRVEHGCALVIETHAPKGNAVAREMVPFGSSAWLRWPELGWKLTPCDEQGEPKLSGKGVRIGQFRGDRVAVDIPDWFDRGGSNELPWAAYWRRGVPQGYAA